MILPELVFHVNFIGILQPHQLLTVFQSKLKIKLMKVFSSKYFMFIAFSFYFIMQQQLIAQENSEFRTLLGYKKGIKVSGFVGSMIEFSNETDQF